MTNDPVSAGRRLDDPIVSPADPPCERCGYWKVVGLWSPDGLPGHEIIVCNSCWNELENA